jgi:hypothetical protein
MAKLKANFPKIMKAEKWLEQQDTDHPDACVSPK